MSRNLRTALLAGLLVCSMTGLAFASVPLYRLFCEVTGFDGTPQRGDAAPYASTGKLISVRFDANTSSALPWTFKPERHREQIAIGAREMAFYTAENLSDRPVTGTATFNVTPVSAAKYFTKVQCFCFSEQELKPGEEVRMPVVYYVDPAILKDPDAAKIDEITLSYTFYPVDQGPSGG
jgi:cytochrome c oxidase assembly protein subunit 11